MTARSETDGVPMVVALHDARPGRRLVVTDPRTLADAAALADAFDEHDRRRQLLRVPSDSGGDPTGAGEVIAVLAAVAEEHVASKVDG